MAIGVLLEGATTFPELEVPEIVEDIQDTLSSLMLDDSNYFLIGGANLALRGLRTAIEDIDMLADSVAVRELAQEPGATITKRNTYPGSNKTVHISNPYLKLPVSATIRLGQPHYPLNFYRHQEYTELIHGVPCMSLGLVMASKRALGRGKDLEDIEHIEIVLQQQAELQLAE